MLPPTSPLPRNVQGKPEAKKKEPRASQARGSFTPSLEKPVSAEVGGTPANGYKFELVTQHRDAQPSASGACESRNAGCGGLASLDLRADLRRHRSASSMAAGFVRGRGRPRHGFGPDGPGEAVPTARWQAI